MDKKKRKAELPPIACRWSDCSKKCTNDWDLNAHLDTHLNGIKSDRDGRFRHSYYHGYYNALLVQGKYECDSNPDIPQCNYNARMGDIIPEIKNNYRCGWKGCERTFVSIVKFHDHIIQHASFDYEMEKSPDDEKPRIQCNWNFCKKILDNKYRLIEHIRTHTNKKQMACFNCGLPFRTRTTLFDHLRRQPDNNTNKFQCAQCFKFFATEKLLHSHMVKHVYCHKCNMCDMTCSSPSALTLHIRYRHLKDKPFECVKCNYRCVRKSDLSQHMHLVHTTKMRSCDEPGCNYTVRTNQALRRHFLEVHENTTFIYICHCCDKPFKNGKSLSVHLMKKHNYKLPSGHKRFTYRVDENGFYRLETTRIESLEVTEQILTPTPLETSDSNCYEIVSTTNADQEQEDIVLSQDTPVAAVKVVISIPNVMK